MHAIRATVRNGRIEPVDPAEMPAEGTELVLFDRDAIGGPVESSSAVSTDDSPQAVAAWLRWYDSLEPLLFTPEERHALDEHREVRKQAELSAFGSRADRLRGLWR